ncbi:MAG: PD40 domain-containing protein [bacterium]|nr:PD40 domain-containing protein [bacterium]
MSRSMAGAALVAILWMLGAGGCGTREPLDPLVPATTTRMTDDDHRELDLAWSPDGRKIAYLRQNGVLIEIAVLDVATRAVTVLAPTGEAIDTLRWSPDGSQILLTASAASTEIRLVTYPGGQERAFSHPCSDDDGGCIRRPFWSFDGSRLAAALDRSPGCVSSQDYELVVYDLGGYGCTIVDVHGPTDGAGGFTWSHLGERVAYWYWVPAAPMKLITTRDMDTGVSVAVTSGNGADHDPIWSPDDTLIAFSSRRGGQTDIWMTDSDGTTAPRRITDDAATENDVAWSPSGRNLSYRVHDGQTDSVWLVPADGSLDPTCLTPDGVSEWAARWSPVGSTLAFVREESGRSDLWVRTIAD